MEPEEEPTAKRQCLDVPPQPHSSPPPEADMENIPPPVPDPANPLVRDPNPDKEEEGHEQEQEEQEQEEQEQEEQEQGEQGEPVEEEEFVIEVRGRERYEILRAYLRLLEARGGDLERRSPRETLGGG